MKQQKEQETIQWISSAHPGKAQGAAPTSAAMRTPQSPRRPALTARLMQPLPEQVASVSLPRGAFLHGPPLHLMAKCITHPHPKVKRGTYIKTYSLAAKCITHPHPKVKGDTYRKTYSLAAKCITHPHPKVKGDTYRKTYILAVSLSQCGRVCPSHWESSKENSSHQGGLTHTLAHQPHTHPHPPKPAHSRTPVPWLTRPHHRPGSP